MKSCRKTVRGVDLEFEHLPDGILVHLENHQFHLEEREIDGKTSWSIVEKLPIWLVDLEIDLCNAISEFLNKKIDQS